MPPLMDDPFPVFFSEGYSTVEEEDLSHLEPLARDQILRGYNRRAIIDYFGRNKTTPEVDFSLLRSEDYPLTTFSDAGDEFVQPPTFTMPTDVVRGSGASSQAPANQSQRSSGAEGQDPPPADGVV